MAMTMSTRGEELRGVSAGVKEDVDVIVLSSVTLDWMVE